MAYKPAQIAQHTAIVLAGAASLSLTVTAGAYIVHQMADTQHATNEVAEPPAVRIPDVDTDYGPVLSDAILTGGTRDLPALFGRFPAESSGGMVKTSQAHTDSPASAGISGKLRLGTAYLGAQVAPSRANSVAFTVDTNALTALTDFLLTEPVRDRLGIHADPDGVTRLRTEVDTHNGEVIFTFSDPTLGEHGLRLDRNPAPSTEHGATVEDSATSGTVDATPDPAVTTANHTIAV
ncbi:hypothetical protein [Nocardia pseudovaccinii]|uniref:hypothetical protein n=1 Tax=Nocardia pseudovaccinii TaxID=189540 RepID=UPI000ABF56F5|nr:hypothetical protein [Nocardia pseudovaccinii]